MPAKQPVFTPRQLALRQTDQVGLDSLTRALQEFGDKAAAEDRQVFIREQQQQAKNDAAQARLENGELPQKEGKFLREDVAEAYNSAAREVFKLSDARDMQDRVSRLRQDFELGRLDDNSPDAFEAEIREMFAPSFSKWRTDPNLGEAYAADLAEIMENEITGGRSKIVHAGLDREKEKVFRMAEESTGSVLDDARDKTLQLLPGADLTDPAVRKQTLETGQALAKGAEAVAEGFMQSLGESPRLRKILEQANDAVAGDWFEASIIQLVNQGRIPEANLLLQEAREGAFFDENRIQNAIKAVETGTGDLVSLVDQRLDQTSRLDDAFGTLALGKFGATVGTDTPNWVPVTTSLQYLDMIQDARSLGVKGIDHKDAGKALSLLRREVGMQQLLMGVDFSEHPDERVRAIAKAGVFNFATGETPEMQAETNKFLRGLQNFVGKAIANNPEDIYNFTRNLTPDGDPTDPRQMNTTFLESGGDGNVAGVMQGEVIAETLGTATRQGNILLGNAASNDPGVPSGLAKSMSNYVLGAIQSYQTASSSNKDEARQRVVMALTAWGEGIKKHNVGKAIAPFKLLAEYDEKMKPHAALLDAMEDARTVDGGLPGGLVDTFLNSLQPVQDSQLTKDFPKSFDQFKKGFGNFDELTGLNAAYNFGLPADDFARSIWRAGRVASAAAAARGEDFTESDMNSLANDFIERLQSGNFVEVQQTKSTPPVKMVVPKGLSTRTKESISSIYSTGMSRVADPQQASRLRTGRANLVFRFDNAGSVMFYVQEGQTIEPLRRNSQTPEGVISGNITSKQLLKGRVVGFDLSGSEFGAVSRGRDLGGLAPNDPTSPARTSPAGRAAR